MKSPESRSDALKVGAVPTHAEGKENDASTSTTKVVDASNPLRRCGGQHARLPLSLIVKRQDLVQLKQEDPTMKKLRPAALNDGLRRNGIKSSSSTNAMDTIWSAITLPTRTLLAQYREKKRFTSDVNVIDFNAHIPAKKQRVTLLPRNKNQETYLF